MEPALKSLRLISERAKSTLNIMLHCIHYPDGDEGGE